MALANPGKTIKETAAKAAEKAKDIGGRTAELASNAAQNVAEGAANELAKARIRFYQPLSRTEFEAPDFDIPKLIIVEDNGSRENIDVMKGAIGWTSKDAGVTVLHLYEREVERSGIQFYPYAESWSVYYVDKFGTRYVNIDKFFDIMQDERRAELFEIAYSLGAKKCTIETYEYAKKVKVGEGRRTRKVKPEVDDVDISCSVTGEISTEALKVVERKSVATQSFKGSDTPVEPKLKWYADNAEITQLVRARCDKDSDNKIHEYHKVIKNSSCAGMTANAAAKVNAVLEKLDAEANIDIKGEYKNEQRRFFKIDIEF